MRIIDLPIPEPVKEILLKEGYSTLYPPQRDAVEAGVLEGKNLVLASPTASGKTLIAELCILNNVFRKGGKALYLTPLRALTSEKYGEFKKYDGLRKPGGGKVKVAISTGDYDSSDPWLSRYDVILTTNEKADSLLRHEASWVRDVGTIVADEIHLLTDPSRGPTIEVLLTRLMQLNPEAQLLALSATVRNAEEVARWIGGTAVTTGWRPVPLKEGVYLHGEVKFNDGSWKAVDGASKDPAVDVALSSVEGGGQALIFAENRRSAVKLALKAGSALKKRLSRSLSRSLEAVSARVLSAGERTSLSEALAEAVRRGCAFHHAGLRASHRRIIEDAFRSGRIKVLAATPTLAAGVNLPARTVVVSSYERYEPGYGRYPISVLEYKQLCGRAGRPKYDSFGESILIAKTEDELEYLMESYVQAEPEKLWSKLAVEKVLRPHALATVASGFARTTKGLLKFFSGTFFAEQYEAEAIRSKLRRILTFLVKEGMVEAKGGGAIEATRFGRRVSELYVDPLSAIILRDGFINGAKKLTELSFLHLVSSTPDMAPKLHPRRREMDQLHLFALDRLEEFMVEEPESMVESEGYEEFLAEVKCAKILLEWINESSEEAIMKGYGVEPGDLFRLVEAADWLVYAARELAKLFGFKAYLKPLDELRFRVKHGVKPELIPLASLEGVGRVRARLLYNSGFRSLEDLKRASMADLARVPSIGLKLSKKVKEQVGGKIRPEELRAVKEGRESEQEVLSKYAEEA